MAKESRTQEPQEEGADQKSSKAPEKDSFTEVVRLCATEVSGSKRIAEGLRDVYGVGVSLAHAIVSVLDFDEETRLGTLSEKELEVIEECIRNPEKHNIPTWLLNRRSDRETGKDLHLIEGDLKLSRDMDIRLLKKIRSYKGDRHARGLPVRGQKTKTSFRGTNTTVGVSKKKK